MSPSRQRFLHNTQKRKARDRRVQELIRKEYRRMGLERPYTREELQ